MQPFKQGAARKAHQFNGERRVFDPLQMTDTLQPGAA